MDNSLLMMIKFLIKLKVEKVYLAGFDGMSENKEENYAIETMRYSVDSKLISTRNEAMTKALKILSKYININFITNTKYDILGDNK